MLKKLRFSFFLTVFFTFNSSNQKRQCNVHGGAD